jgi:ApbE superfamily uncharacterized protein (UPF0280 family)
MILKDQYKILNDGRLLVDYGPVTMSIQAKKQGKISIEAELIGAEIAIETLNRLINYLDVAKKWVYEIDLNKVNSYPIALKTMIESVKHLQNDKFTPMAAVAGTFSDLVMEEILLKTDVDYVVINNGGDIAFYKKDMESVFKVGIMDDITTRNISHSLNIRCSSQIKGITTSGFGGRSLTKGVASAVTVVAKSSSLADAAATEIANCTYINSPNIETCLAEDIDFDTDIKGLRVVKTIGKLSNEEKFKSINKGLEKTMELYERKMIEGAVIFVQGEYDYYPKNNLDFTIGKK